MPEPGHRNVLLTGATGFLGPYVAEALRGEGWQVRAALRRAMPVYEGGSVAVGSIGPRTDWSAALQGIDAVVHLAGLAHRPPAAQRAAREEYAAVNVDGTLNLARQAKAAGVRDFVFMSSIAVNGSSTDGRSPFREDDAPDPKTLYGETKAAAEAGLRAIASPDMAVTAVRPPMIYGRHAKGSFRTLSNLIARGVPLPFGAVRNRRAFIGAKNLAQFVVFALKRDRQPFDAFIVADDEQLSTADFARALATAQGRDAWLVPVPVTFVSSVLRLIGKADLIDSAFSSLELDTAKAKAAGWAPQVPMKIGLTRA